MDLDAPWRFVLVEDDLEVREQVESYIKGELFSFGSVEIFSLSSFDEALSLLGQRKVDLLVLDVKGDQEQDRTAGIKVLERWRATGFSPVVFYTALPEIVREYENALVKVVGKDVGGLRQLVQTINGFFELKIPQTHRAIAEHFNLALREYMWGFVLENWDKLEGLIDQPDFVRLLLRRLAAQFSRERVERVVSALYSETPARPSENESAHPTEYYIKPPIGPHAQLGDIRRISGDLVVVVWPSCDLVFRGDACKVERALCAKAIPLTQAPEYQEWIENKSTTKRQPLESLMKNKRQGKGVQSERFHFLPAAWDIPASIIDFQDLRHVEVSEVREAECVATIASPFAESISARFMRYLGRLGTPDLDIEACMSSLELGGRKAQS
jgi:CheY-like chemotaxis protein